MSTERRQSTTQADDRPHRDASATDASPSAGGPALQHAADRLQRQLVQRRANGGTPSEATVSEAADEGRQGPASTLPHLPEIQRSFGGHDVSGVRAHTGEAATAASERMGAHGYAVDGEVAFRGQPSLFTAAHEAAHVVQQRGGVQRSAAGQDGDAYERHADQVASAVVEGKSAEGLLSQSPVGQGGGGGAVVQRRTDETTPQHPAPAAASLSAPKAQAAIAANQARQLKPASWAQVAHVTKSPKETLSVELVQAVAAWQASKGLSADGICGDITLQWMNEDPAGQGLADLVKKETTMFMGLNPESLGAERNLLNQKTGGVVDATGNGQHQDQAHVGNEWVSLRTPEGLDRAFATLPNLPKERAEKMKAFVSGTGAAIGDEVFNMMSYLWKVETGGGLLKRVVLSGHSSGWTLWGGHSMEFGSIQYDKLLELFGMFPHACAQVEDLAFSACYSLRHDAVDRYRAVFPCLKTIWGYAEWSPSAGTGSTRHLANWEKGTKGHQGGAIDAARKEVAKGSGGRDQNVAIWSVESGYQTNVASEQMGYSDILAAVESRRGDFDTAVSPGTINMSALNDLYANLQALVHDHATELGGDLQKYQTMLIKVLYLREWEPILDEFIGRFGTTVKAGYDEAGQPAPHWSGMSRPAALQLIAAFRPSGPKGQEAQRLMFGFLRDLDPSLIHYGSH